MKKMLTALAALFVPLSAAAHTDEPTEVHSYILLDRTGSMQPIWDEALGSVNTYAQSVSEKGEDETVELKTKVTLAIFDAQEGLQFDVLRKDITEGNWTDVTNDEASPRGMTPLFDAIGRMVSLAETDNPEKAVIVVMTDGAENSSREMTKEDAKAALDRAEAKGWEVVFLGAEFAKFDDADAVGVNQSQQMAVSKDKLNETMNRLGKKTRSYGEGVAAAPLEFTEEDREIADEEDVKDRKGS